MNRRSRKLMFSIITVCFNNLEGLKRTHLSLKRQKLDDYEWIVVDGDSTDGTRPYLESLNSGNLIWNSEPDEGLYDAMNKGIQLASGMYLIFMNSDDEFADAKTLFLLANAIETNDYPDFIYGDALERKSSAEIVYKKARSHRWLWYGMFTHHQSMVYKLEPMNELGIRYQYNKYPAAADYAFTAMLISTPDSKILRVKSPLCVFMQGGVSSASIPQGSLDQWLIKRDILGLSAISRYFIFNIHILLHCIKTYLPNLYEWARFKKKTNSYRGDL